MPDRYLKVILTVIAIELLWLGVRDMGTHVSAQATPAPMAVVIKGVDIADSARDPVRNSIPVYSPRALKVETDRAIPVIGAAPLKVEIDRPVKVEADRPLLIESVPLHPGEKAGRVGIGDVATALR